MGNMQILRKSGALLWLPLLGRMELFQSGLPSFLLGSSNEGECGSAHSGPPSWLLVWVLCPPPVLLAGQASFFAGGGQLEGTGRTLLLKSGLKTWGLLGFLHRFQ